jgi:hypothetical protein
MEGETLYALGGSRGGLQGGFQRVVELNFKI